MHQPMNAPKHPLRLRLAWFAGLWLTSALALGIVGFAIRSVLHP